MKKGFKQKSREHWLQTSESEASSRRFGLIDTVSYQLVQFAKDHLVLATKKTKKYIYHMIKEDN